MKREGTPEASLEIMGENKAIYNLLNRHRYTSMCW